MVYESKPPIVQLAVQLAELLLDALLPSLCLGCARRLPPGRSPLLLCLPCRGRFPAPAIERCPRCLGSRCAGICHRPPSRWIDRIDRVIAPWPYDPPLDAVLRGLKFARLEHLGSDLAALLAPFVRSVAPGADAVTSVPLHPLRRLRRGFDQAESIARPLAAALDLPFVPTLRRRRWTPPQTRLGGQRRRRNLDRAFVARGEVPAAVFLVDDVVTTGTTVRAAASALARAGAVSVTVVAVAATPSRGTTSS